jgi:hypothetical protein
MTANRSRLTPGSHSPPLTNAVERGPNQTLSSQRWLSHGTTSDRRRKPPLLANHLFVKGEHRD